MERWYDADLAAVSRYWTPDHLDVTDVPMTYAKPKPAWIDGYDRRKRRRIDDCDRMFRRRMHSGALVQASDIPVLPPVTLVTPPEPEPLLSTLYGAVARLFPSRRIAV
ncbi:MAG TPA: hypothetical protein VGN14_01805 [Candidatus Elarobacter sp.]